MGMPSWVGMRRGRADWRVLPYRRERKKKWYMEGRGANNGGQKGERQEKRKAKREID